MEVLSCDKLQIPTLRRLTQAQVVSQIPYGLKEGQHAVEYIVFSLAQHRFYYVSDVTAIKLVIKLFQLFYGRIQQFVERCIQIFIIILIVPFDHGENIASHNSQLMLIVIVY